VVGYEALVRGNPGNDRSPAELFAAARAEDLVAEFDAALREAAVRGFQLNGSGPFALFLNAAAETLGDAAEQIPATRQTVVIEITEQALVANPDALLHALTRFRVQGWGVAIDDVGADSRSLALMPLLYPDVIKLDLRRLQERDPADVARIVGAVGAESERRQALVLAEGIDSEEQLAAARAFGATLGQGFLLGEPAPLPGAFPEPGRKLRLTDSGGDLAGDPPFRRVTNWKRPAVGSRDLAERTASLIMRQALALGETAVVLAAFPDESHIGPEQAAELQELAQSLAFVGALCAPPELARSGNIRTGPLAADDPLRGTWTVTALGPGLAACFVAQRQGDGTYELATSYDRDLVVESALLIMARLRPLAPPAR
jgi:EAL domain-containing protein (putative c-di-GMP-specific phosphodiesterase class I)